MNYEIQIGKNYCVKSGDSWYTGKCVGIVPFGIVLDQCAWIASMGCRFNEFFRDGKSPDMEIEMFSGPQAIRWDLYGEWPHPLFKESI